MRARRWNFEVEGVNELVQMFQDMDTTAIAILEEATKAAADIVLHSAKQKCPVDTGELRDSLEIKLEKSKKTSKKAWRILSKKKYAFAVEVGSRTKAAKPYMRPALDENKEAIRQKLSEKILAGLDGVI